PPQAENETVGLEEIIVQARKVNENLQDVPVAVTAFTGEQLEAQNVQRVQDFANFTPGLAIREGQSTRSALTLTLRGQVQTDILATLDPSVGTYVDGIYWSRAYGLNADLLDVSSVQVLKGPQGTLFGRNTTGGAMLINSNTPDMADIGGKASLTYGRFDEMTATGVINLPIVKDRIALRIAGQRATRDGYTLNTSVPGTALTGNTVVRRSFAGSPAGTRLDDRDRWNFRGKLQIDPTDNLSLLFSAEYFDMEERAPARQLRLLLPTYTASNPTFSTGGTGALFIGLINGATPANATAVGLDLAAPQIAGFAANADTTQNNETPYSAARTYTYGFTAALNTEFGEIRFISGIRKIRSFAGIDLEGSSFAIHFTEAQQRLKQQSAELQITGDAFGDAVDFAAGAFVFHETGFDQSISITVPALNPATSHFYGLIDNDSIGVYGQATWHITDALSFTGGLRYSVDDKRLEARNNNYLRNNGLTVCSIIPVAPFNAGGEVVGPAECGVRRADSFAGVSYTAGLEYRVSDDVLVYIKTAKGFRSGGQN
ncbi:MAG: TonB-dependent receptor, partial [Sphingopyxis sp.]